MRQEVRIALAGNPNSGKTTMFNELTGTYQHVGNWPGVTVEKKEGSLKGRRDVKVMDLPGIYSLSPYTLEEVISRNYLLEEEPDVIIDIVDASNLERNLYLTTQLLETGIPVVVALNMMDIIINRGDVIDTEKLSEALGCPVVETSAMRGKGIENLVQAALAAADEKTPPTPGRFSDDVEPAIQKIEALIKDSVSQKSLRWYAIKLFERDGKLALALSEQQKQQIEKVIAECETAQEDEAESIITSERYVYISGMIGPIYKKKSVGKFTVSDRIDRIVT
ncbi:MAG TPA: ferrous iron transporter B, partial [Clostridiales bacterium]|nr:ferrous iron transporter B [Clostridiales bacterium]